MTNRSDIARELYKEGMSCPEIGRTLGMSRQAVYCALKHDSRSKPKPKVHKTTIEKIRYIGLRDWMLENNISIAELARQSNVSQLYSSLCGTTEPKKSTIDAILSVTGMTYEECFKEE